MPTFLKEFASFVDSKRHELKDKILKGKPNWLEGDFKRYISEHWVKLENLDKFTISPANFDVLAIDSGIYHTLLPNGGIFYIIRSISVRKDVIAKKIEADVIFSKAKTSRIEEFISTKMELMEFELALEALKDGFKGDAILLDGSLYGRASHVPMESKVEEGRDLLLRYFEVYKDLLELCKKSGVLLVGVSKESRSTFYRDYLLSLIFSEKLRGLNLDEKEKMELNGIFYQILDNEKVALSRFSKLKERHGDKLKDIELILMELTSSRPDYQLIMNHVSSIGFMTPLLLGPSLRMSRRFGEYRRDPRGFVENYFPRSTIEKGEDFIRWATKILNTMLEFPSFVSFYILLDRMDSPIRIDFPYYDKHLIEIGWPERAHVDIEDLLRILISGYCGLNVHNLWLESADEKVRLSEAIVDEIYFPYLEKLFGKKILRGRRYRHVRFP
ncbi:MAG: DNA double-strand break repair nuclease NurA [Archaeoglobaceae archaeon]